MSDPRRWRDGGDGLDADELRLLRAGLRANVPRGAKRAVWLALGAQLSSAVAAASTATGGALTVASLAKTAAVGLLLGATSVGAVAVVRHVAAPETAPVRAPSHVPVAPAAVTSSPVAVTAPDVRSEPAPEPPRPEEAVAPVRRSPGAAREAGVTVAPAPPAGPSVAAFPAEATARTPDAESMRVASARKLLRTGRGSDALAALDAIAREFPNGALAQEREALAIEALRVSGRGVEARARATQFLARYPASPHASSVRRALE